MQVFYKLYPYCICELGMSRKTRVDSTIDVYLHFVKHSIVEMLTARRMYLMHGFTFCASYVQVCSSMNW
jgi:hypothetical protein